MRATLAAVAGQHGPLECAMLDACSTVEDWLLQQEAVLHVVVRLFIGTQNRLVALHSALVSRLT